jgi:DNA repair exonuclease SbcCD ATPase subunit
MIRSLKVKNFQSHAEAELNFVPGVNVIVGKSTSGKTALLRALNWCLTNRPLGMRVKSTFADKKDCVEVCADFISSTIQLKKESSGEAEYCLVNGDVPQVFKKVGVGVPDVIVAAANFDELNMANQLDQHFLITSSDGEVARVMNRITRIEKVDEWVAEATKLVNTWTKDTRRIEQSIMDVDVEIQKYSTLDELEKLVEEAFLLNDERYKYAESIDKGTQYVASVDEVVKNITTTMEWLSVENIVVEAETYSKEYLQAVTQEAVISNFVQLTMDCEHLQGYIQDLGTLTEEASSISLEINEVSGKINKVEDLLRSISSVDASISHLVDSRNTIIEEYSGLLERIGRCPICSSEISGNVVQHIVEELK